MAFGAGNLSVQLKSILSILRPSVTNERELSSYAIRITGLCLAGALAVDGPMELIFFTDWAMCLREWAITVILVIALTMPVARAFGKANLELYRAKSLADQLSHTDALTGLLNRRALLEIANAEMPRVLALVIVDIDRFKHVNDTYGHLAGDTVIQSVSRVMTADLGAFGSVARIGGEEFALLSSSVSSEALFAKLNEFRGKIEAMPVVINGLAVNVTISAGVALRLDGDTFEHLFSRADRALYLAKTSGRNRVQIYAKRSDPKERDGVGQPGDDPSLRRTA